MVVGYADARSINIWSGAGKSKALARTAVSLLTSGPIRSGQCNSRHGFAAPTEIHST